MKRKVGVKSVTWFTLLVCACLLSLNVQAKSKRVLPTMLTLYAGESKVITAPDIERLSVGKSDMLSTTLLKNGDVVLTAESAGETTMQVWFTDQHRETLSIVIVESNGWREVEEVKALLKDIDGIKISTIGRRVVVDGELRARDLERVETLKERYSDMLVLARSITTDKEVEDIKYLLRDVSGIQINVVDQQVVIDGNLQDRDLERIETLKELYPDMVVLARATSEFEEKMIYFDVRVTEFSKDYTEQLGINWTNTSIPGPILSLAGNIAQGGDVTPDLSANSGYGAFDNHATDAVGSDVFFGIATELSSLIDLLESSGSALTLSRPRLSARSGGSADLAVGGEVPVVTSSISGSSVEYKDYGILLNIEPMLDTYNNITARVGIEISQLDLANAVSGQPAFKKRSTENDIKLKPGETLVLSGLITNEEQASTNKVKWLADIPILGNLFKSDSFIKGETELVIFITPTVLNRLDEGVNLKEIAKADELVKKFQQMNSEDGLAE